MNQLGGVGRNRSQFLSNADGVVNCTEGLNILLTGDGTGDGTGDEFCIVSNLFPPFYRITDIPSFNIAVLNWKNGDISWNYTDNEENYKNLFNPSDLSINYLFCKAQLNKGSPISVNLSDLNKRPFIIDSTTKFNSEWNTIYSDNLSHMFTNNSVFEASNNGLDIGMFPV